MDLSEIKAGVLDSGFETSHEDLSGQISFLPTYQINSSDDHGSHVAGIMAAKNNEVGIRGIADTAKLICTDKSPTETESYINTGEYLEIFKQMIENEVRVINASWGNHLQSEKGYLEDVYWEQTGYFNEIGSSYIRLGSGDNIQEYSFEENNVTFYIDSYWSHKKVSYDKFSKKAESGNYIGLTIEGNYVTEICLINSKHLYEKAIKETGAYESYLKYVESLRKRTGFECILMMVQLLLNEQEDFIIVKSAGNGYDNGKYGLGGVDAKYSCYFCGVDEDIYNLLGDSTRKFLLQKGIDYAEIKNHIIVVGAVKNEQDKNGNYIMCSFSNYGKNVDICAPGEDIYSTVTNASGNYDSMLGTSMATPMVSGAATLLWQVNSDLSAAEVKNILVKGTKNKAVGVGNDKGTKYPMLNIGDAVKSVIEEKNQEKKSSDNISRDVVLVLDRSGSMEGAPIAQTKEAATKFVQTVFEKDSRVALVTYESMAAVECGLTNNQQELLSSIENIYTGDMTNMYAGLEQADQLLQNSQADRKIIVLMSDGLPNEGKSDGYDYTSPLLEYAEEMKNKGYYIYTLGFFTAVSGSELYNAQQLMEGIASPRLHYEVNSAEDLVFFFDDIANQIAGTEYVYIRIACPVDVTVSSGGETLSSKTESENTRTSFGALTYENVQEESEDAYEDDFGYYSGTVSQDQAKILRLNMDKDYDIEIEGYDSGEMNYTISFPNDKGEYDDVREFPGIAVTASTKATSNTSEEDATYLKVDDDGDGKIDTTYKTEANGEMKEVKDHTLLYIILISVGVLVIFITILIIVLVRTFGKKKSAGQGGGNVQAAGYIYGAFGIYGGQSYPLIPGQQCVVGRRTNSDIQLLHGEVSKVHCVIQMLPDGVYQVTDYSSNGTYYNNQRLKKGEPYRLPKGALLAIGDAENVLELR